MLGLSKNLVVFENAILEISNNSFRTVAGSGGTLPVFLLISLISNYLIHKYYRPPFNFIVYSARCRHVIEQFCYVLIF